LFPPEDDNWWDGNFTHFDFDTTFNEIANTAPKTMADKSFKDLKWILGSNQTEPDRWNESEISFFSDFFMNFLQDGKI
jgi:hypothetical protein